MKPKSDVRERFESKIIRHESGCWGFRSNHNSRGYPKFKINGTSTIASRVAWSLFRGEIPAGLYVCHTCDNPSCVNPDHLFVGTQQDNMDDCASKGRRRDPAQREACVRGHLMIGENVRIAIDRRRNSPRRYCRACERLRSRRRQGGADVEEQ